METTQHLELFRTPGPDATLEYLWGRLQDRDLSQDEALAMLGAVHRVLGDSQAEDAGVYWTYSRFMESLSRGLPLVHDFVVAQWIENHRRMKAARLKQSTDAAMPPAQPVDPDKPTEPPKEMAGEGLLPSPETGITE